MSSTRNSKIIKASPEKLFIAFTDPQALETWQAPGNMTGKVHNFDLRAGGGYEMSLYYPESETEAQGKTAGKEDRFRVRFIELIPPYKIVQAVNFASDNPDFAGEMMMEATFEPKDSGTQVTLVFNNIPKGIRPEDNEAGTKSSLEKLAKFVE